MDKVISNTYIKLDNALQDAIDSSQGVVVFSLDKKYCYTSFSKSHKKIMNKIWGVEIQIGDCMLDFLSPEDAAKAKINFDRALQGESFTLIEEYGDAKLWRSFWENQYDPIFDAEGNITGLVVFVVDVSKHLGLINTLQDTRERLNIALEVGNTGVWEWDIPSGKIQWTENVYKIFGIKHTAEALTFTQYKSFIHPDDRTEVLQAIKDTLKTNKPYKVLHRVLLQNGDIRWILGFGKVFFDDAGKPIRMIGTVQDFTHQKQAESDLENKNKELSRLNMELDRFVDIASHDLRAPLASLLGLIRLAQQETNLTEIRRMLEMQEKVLLRLDTFTKDILDYARNKKLESAHTTIDFSTLIQESFEFFEHLDTAVKIHKTYSVNVRDTFVSDEHRLKLILNNLISNGIKYADPSKEQPYVHVSVLGNKKGVEIEVSDNGEGIRDEAKGKLFNMFYRATKSGEGTGLGLYLVKETVDKLGGKINFESTHGKGTTFKVILPGR